MDLFGTAGIRGDAQTTVTPAFALAIGRAVATAADAAPTVALGHDGRTTSPGLAAAVEAGLISGGATVRRIGQVPTPTLAYASRDRHGVMITASHNPPADNGIKLFVDGMEYDTDAEAGVEAAYATEPEPVAYDAWGTATDASVLEAYREAVTTYITNRVGRLDGLRVAIDCGNGVGGVATPQVLSNLGAQTISLNANIDGTFPARESKPTPESLAETRAFVADADVDLGLAHDGDADRLVVIGPDGEIIHEDTVVAVLAERYVRWSDATEPVVITTPNASGRIDDRVAAAGGRIERTALGTLHEAIATADASVAFAAEPWKHVHPTFGGWIDGICSAALVTGLVAEAGGIAPLIEPVDERPYRKESLPCPEAAKTDAMATLKTSLPEQFPEAAVDTEYGVRLTFDNGDWVLLRPSGTEPYLRLYAESEDLDAFLAPIATTVEDAIEGAQ
ncbi:MAG: phosphomannomutase [Salinarchaeum sp.]